MLTKTQLILLGLSTGMLTLFLESAKGIALPARIESTTGIVKLKRQNWTEFKPVSINTELNKGDQIFPLQGVRVTVLCPDLQQRPVSSGVPSGLKTICPIWETLKAKNPPPPGSLGGTNALIPYLISPRHTLILTDTPILRWNEVSRTRYYTIKVMDSQGIIWEKQVSQTQISYPGTPVFRPGIPYSVTIQTDGGQSSEQDKASKIEFIRLHSSEVATIQAEVNKIEQLNINKPTKALILADFYGTYTLPTSTFNNYVLSSKSLATYHLTSEAITILETTIKQGQNSAIIERSLADLYWQIGLANLATNHYLKAIKLAQIPEQLEEKTLAQFGLGEVYAALGDNNQAKIWYSKAREGYLALGDSARANFVIQLIESLP